MSLETKVGENAFNMYVQTVAGMKQHTVVLQTGILSFFFQTLVISNQLLGKIQEVLEYVILNPQKFQGETLQV